MENNAETTQGGDPQVPPAKPPDQSVTQPNEVLVSGAHVLNEAMSEDTSEDETPTINALEQQPAAKNGVSLPIKSASDPGGDHVGTADGCPGVISQDHAGAANHGSEETALPPAPNPGTEKTPKSRNLDKQEAKMSKRHFDKRMTKLINATRDLAQEQHTDNLKIEAGVGVSTQISQDTMQFLTEFEEKVKESHKVLRDKMVLLEDRLCATENSSNDALALSTDVKTSIKGMAEAVTKFDRQLAVYTRVSERLEGFLRENQSPRVRQDSKRLKRTRGQSPAPEIVDLERESNAQTMTPQAPAPAPMAQEIPRSEGTHSVARQSVAPPRNRPP